MMPIEIVLRLRPPTRPFSQLLIDLVNHSSSVLPFESRKEIRLLAPSHDGRLLLVLDVDGRALLVNLQRRVVLHRFNFKKRVRCARHHWIRNEPSPSVVGVRSASTYEHWIEELYWMLGGFVAVFNKRTQHYLLCKATPGCLWAPGACRISPFFS